MKIEHITYEEARGGRPSATKKMKNYLSSKLPRHLDLEESPKSADAERPTTMWPRMDVAPSDDLPEMTAYLVQKHHVERAAKKEENVVPSTNSSTVAKPAEKKPFVPAINITSPPPPLRRKPNFPGNFREKLGSQKPTDALEETTSDGHLLATAQRLRPAIREGKLEKVIPLSKSQKAAAELKRNNSTREKMEKAHHFRTAIRDGKMERVVPPVKNHEEVGRVPPPRPVRKYSLKQSSTKSSSKSSSTTSKLMETAVECIRTSAEIIDEKRREVTGRFAAPFEHITYPSFSRSRRSSEASSSTASFYCIGKEEQDLEEVKALKVRQAANGRRLSGAGTSPFTNPAADRCQLCGKRGAGGLRALCRFCEKDFARPKTKPFEGHRSSSWTSSFHSEEEISPCPPLKDEKFLPMRRVADSNDTSARVGDEKPLPQVPLHAATIEHPTPQRTHSCKGTILAEGDSDDEKFLKWQSKSMREEFEKSQKLFARWSGSFDIEDVSKVGDDGHFPSVKGESSSQSSVPRGRDTRFYAFWDDVLNSPKEKAFSRARKRLSG